MVGWGHCGSSVQYTVGCVARRPLPVVCRRLADNACGSYTPYLSIVGHFGFRCLATYLLILSAFTFIVMSQRPDAVLSAILATAGMTLLLIDSEVFAVLTTIITPLSGAGHQLRPERNGARLAAYVYWRCRLSLLIEDAICDMELAKAARSHAPPPFHKAACGILFKCSFIASHLIYIWADANFCRPITMRRANLPALLIR
ncbi:DUF3413 domain-containing protein [Salmonella enterica subsp. enterica]|nr:DUF3413 domain-containing protein [Salmonella enterica subsp. enterica]